MAVTYVEHMGSDYSVSRAARNSFGKQAEPWRPEKDPKLLASLARMRHELPFAHPHVTFHWKAPIFVARQLAKHQIGGVWSEVSRRYVKGLPEFWWPKVWRKGSPDIKQGSTDEEVDLTDLGEDYGYSPGWVASDALTTYEILLSKGVCAEQARMILPQNMMTEWTWTGSLLFWSRVWNLRVKPDAQQETRQLVNQIGPKMEELFPHSWPVLTAPKS